MLLVYFLINIIYKLIEINNLVKKIHHHFEVLLINLND